MNTAELASLAGLDGDALMRQLETAPGGLSSAEARARLARHGPNAVASSRRRAPALAFLAQFARPLPLLLLGLSALDFATGQGVSAAVIVVIVVLSSLLGFVQEYRSDRAVQKLRAMVRTTVRILRQDGAQAGAAGAAAELPLDELVPGDIVLLAAGDPIPAEVRFLEAVDLFVDQSSLTGESLPVEKHDRPVASGAPRTGSATSASWGRT